jgi:hypothetical protein
MAGVAGDAFDLPIGRGEKALGEFDSPVGDEAAHPLADQLGEAVAEVISMKIQIAGNKADAQLGIAKVLLDVLDSFNDCGVAGVHLRSAVCVIRGSCRGFAGLTIRLESTTQETGLSGHEVLNEDVEDFHVVEKGMFGHGAGAGQCAGGQASAPADDRDDGAQPATIALVPVSLGALPQLSQV